MAHFKNNWYVGSGCGTVDKAVASKRPWVQIRSSVTFIEHVFTLKYEAWRGWAFKNNISASCTKIEIVFSLLLCKFLVTFLMQIRVSSYNRATLWVKIMDGSHLALYNKTH